MGPCPAEYQQNDPRIIRMDSVITQVKKDEGPPSVEADTGEDGSETGTQNGGTTDNTAAANTADTPTSIPEKGRKKKHKLFQSLLCCFGLRRRPKFSPSADSTVPSESSPAAQSEQKPLLPDLHPADVNKKCLVIDLDETLVHSSFKPISNADFIVPVEIDGTIHQVYVLKRPYVDEFLKKMGELYECVLFTASLAKYADPVTDLLDKWDVFRARLFRESCVFHRGNYVKDLGRLGRKVDTVIILDNSPASYFFHPENAVPCTSWFDDMDNKELLEMIPFFDELSRTDNIYSLLRTIQQKTEGPAPAHGAPPSSPPPPLQQTV